MANRLQSIVTHLTIVTLPLLTSLQVQAQDVAEQMALAAVREYDALQPGVRQAAEQLLGTLTQIQNDQEPEPALEWFFRYCDSKEFTHPSGGSTILATKQKYRIVAVHQTYKYSFKGIPRIFRTGMRETPFEAHVVVNVEKTIRRSEVQRTDALPIPEGHELSSFQPAVRESAEYIRPDVRSGPARVERYPLPYAPYTILDSSEAPSIVQSAMKELIRQLDKEPARHVDETHTVVFRYSVAKRDWMWNASGHEEPHGRTDAP